jgi:hypothetical protein
MKKIILILMVLISSVGFGQYWIDLDLPDLSGVSTGETVYIDVTATDVVVPNDIGLFYIYVEWDDAILDYVSMSLSPEMITNIGMWNILFQSGNASSGGVETCVGGFLNTVVPGFSFSINPGDVFFTIEAIYQGDGTTGTELNFQFTSKDEGGKLSKGVTEILAGDGTPYTLNYTVPGGSVNMGPTTNMWTGAVDNDWFNAGNWSEGVVPTNEDVVIDVTTKGNPVIFGGNATTGALAVMPGAGIQIDPHAGLTTNGLFTNDGDLIIATDAGGYSGSFIDLGGLAGSGMFYMDRIMTCSMNGDPNNPAEPIGWHYISAPIDGVSTDDMLDYYINQWDETTSMWMNYAGTQPCIPYAPAETLDGMGAWSVKYDQNWSTYGCPQTVNGDVVMYNGPFTSLHTGPYSSPATFTAGTYQGWNMFGNPYPSGLDLTDGTFAWDPAVAASGYALYDGCPGNYLYYSDALGSYAMPVGNAFFVEYSAAGSFDLTGGERAHDPDFYYKDEVTSLLTLEAIGQGDADILHVRFMEQAQAGFAKDGDFHKLISTTVGLPQIYTTAGTDKLAINALPATEMVPMGFTSVTSGQYTISATETSEFTEVYLQDLVTGAVTDLLAGSYTFEYTVGANEDRFIIHFAPVGINDLNASTVKIWSLDNNIIVNVPANVTGEIAVYNMMGQEVTRTDIAGTETQIKVSDVNTNYVVKVVSDNSAVTGKVYVK